jgi:hypothetical protein
MVSTGLSVLAGFSVAGWRRPGLARLVPAAAAAMMFAETLSIPIPLLAAPVRPVHTLEFLATHPAAPVAHWPMPAAANIGSTWDPKYMYFSVYHWRPLLNGYSGYHPDSYLQFLRRTSAFPEPAAVAAMQRAGVRYLILHSTPDRQRYAKAVSALRLNDAVAYQFNEQTPDEEVALFVIK